MWDIETADWDRFVCGSLWTEKGGTEVYTDEDAFGNALIRLPKGAQVWAHAGGTFDVLWLLDWCNRRKCVPEARVTLSGASIACCAIKGGPVLRDSNRLIPMSLKKASTMFGGGAMKEALGLPCKCGKDCGGYCSISADMPARWRRRLKEYLEMDIAALRDTLDGLWTFAHDNGIDLAGTLAGATWRTAKRWCGLDDAEWDVAEYQFLRLGYYGGRVEAGATYCPRVWNYDRTQAYPAAMCKPLPIGDHRGVSGRQAARAFNADKPGFYQAVVDVPECVAPPLPMRWGNRITYPWGKVEGVWPRDELKHAEEMGAKVRKVDYAVVWDKERPILKEYMEHCFRMREAAETESLKTWLKLLANSLSGAFAQQPERELIRFTEELANNPAWERVGRYNWIWRKEIYSISNRGHIHWAGTLTGDARVELDREIEHAGDSWCYSDTDSVKASRELKRNVGHGLGLWKYEGTAVQYECIAPKVYSYMEDGKRFARAKGIKDAAGNWDDIRGRRPVTSVGGVESLLVAARGDKLFKRKELTRQLRPETKWCGGRLRDGHRTRAPHVSQLEELPN